MAVVSVGAALAALLLTSFHALRQEIADLRGEFAEMRGEPREPTQTHGARGRVAGGAPRGQLRTGGRPTSASPRLSFVVVLLALAAPLPLDGQIPPEFRQAAEQGDAEAQFLLGLAHTGGEGVLKDDAEAVRWFLMAAEQGDASAQFNLGVMYANGEGVLKDEAEAVRWFLMAAEQGDASAQFNLGVMYANGEGVPEDDAEAVRWYRIAAEQGHADAQFYLGVMYYNGRGVLKDATLAHMWYNIAGANGSEIAREWRDTIEDDMTATQIARATELARTCMDSDYENCEG